MYIVLGLALLVALLLSIRASIHIEYKNELKIYLKVLFFKIWLFPEGKLKINPKKYEKLLKGDNPSPPAIISEISKESKKNGLVENVKMIARLMSSLLKACAPYMKVRLAKVHVFVGSSDAAKTAILYGVVSGAVAILVDNIDEFTNLHKLKKKSIIVEPDFLSDKTTADINVSLSISVYGLIASMLKVMIKHNIMINKNSVNNTPKGI